MERGNVTACRPGAKTPIQLFCFQGQVMNIHENTTELTFGRGRACVEFLHALSCQMHVCSIPQIKKLSWSLTPQ